MGVVSGAKIAGATRIRAATRAGASKYVLTATSEPAECLTCHFGDISASKEKAAKRQRHIRIDFFPFLIIHYQSKEISDFNGERG